MGKVRRGDRYRIDLRIAHHRGGIRVDLAPTVVCGDLFGPFLNQVANRCQRSQMVSRIDLGMDSTPTSHADNTESDFFHARPLYGVRGNGLATCRLC